MHETTEAARDITIRFMKLIDGQEKVIKESIDQLQAYREALDRTTKGSERLRRALLDLKLSPAMVDGIESGE